MRALDRARSAVVYHPGKLTGARWGRILEREERRTDRPPSLWLPTRAEETTGSLIERLEEAGGQEVEALIAAGGDGTVRLVAEAALRLGKPLGLWPVGSTNLFARNIGLPVLDPAAALRAGLAGTEHPVDVISLSVVLAGGERLHRIALVLAGFGIDAQMVQHTSDAAKAQLGWLAYVHGVRIGITRRDRFNLTYSLDGSTPQDARLLTAAIGNGGVLPAGLVLLPDALVDDGRLDVLMLHPDGMRGWRDVASWFVQENSLTRRLMRRRGLRRPLRTGPAVQLATAREIRMHLRRPEAFQVDGEYLGKATAVRAVVHPGALTVRTSAD